MKKTKVLFWIFTGLFSAFMLFTAIPDVLMTDDTVKFIVDLGYPRYIIPFLGVAKIIGSIVILIPGFPRLKEWAYAGLAIDLIGATYSNICVHGWQIGMLFMLVPFTLGTLSYLYYHRLSEPA